MATFTWTATTAAGSTAWETPSAWVDSTSGNPGPGAFTTAPGNDYLINGSNLFTVGDIGAGGTGTPDIVNSLTVTDVQAQLQVADGASALDVTTTLSLNSLLNLGTAAADASVLSMGGSSDGGTIDLGANGKLEGAQADRIVDAGSTPTQIIGSGTIIAEDGIFTLGTSVQVASGNAIKFQIDPNATLSIADAVGSGTIMFTAASGSGLLDVAALSTFNASVKNLYVGTTKNVATSYIDFLNVGTAATATVTGFTSSGATLTIFTSTGSQTIPILGNYLGKNANVNYVSDGAGGTNVFFADVPCYVSGTALLTPDGEAAVESLRAGDVVMTSEGGCLMPRTVVWTGLRWIDLAHHPRPRLAAPIRFRRGALGADLPRRDLLLSPDHCLFLDGGLVPAKLLVNGMTIVRDMSVPSVAYHHIELERHAVLIAEGVAAESYLDTGNRAGFSNAGLETVPPPECGINERPRCWEADACAPLLTTPEQIRPLWERFADRARSLGFEAPVVATTPDPALRLLVDGRTLRPLPTQEAADRRIARFVVPHGASSVRLLSRRATHGEMRPWLDDPRPLGVAVRSVTLCDRTGVTVAGADHPALTDGWHAAESTADGAPWRWTAGDAVLPIVSEGPCLVEITVGTGVSYLDEGDCLAA